MSRPALWPLLALALAAAPCQAGVFARVDPVSGMTVFSNVPTAKAGGAPVPATATATIAAATFPRVSGERQQQRDGLRRDILETELGGEQQALAAATARGAASDILRRHVANVEALKRELAGVR